MQEDAMIKVYRQKTLSSRHFKMLIYFRLQLAKSWPKPVQKNYCPPFEKLYLQFDLMIHRSAYVREATLNITSVIGSFLILTAERSGMLKLMSFPSI